MFFAIQPKKAILADANARLIETYEQIRDNPAYIAKLLRRHHSAHSDVHYYAVRDRKHPRSASQRAAQFIYLNRTCWNGLYRVNRQGEFNVPRGTKTSVVLEADDFSAVSRRLLNVELLAQDFAKTMAKVGRGDLVYVDPPYTVKHKYNGFAKYNDKMFSWADQVRLRDAVAAAIARGAFVAVSNADHPSIAELYCGIGVHRKVSRSSVIAGRASHRGIFDELLITSWPSP